MQVQIRREQGQRVAVKQATGPAAVAGLHREARMLTLARHPGVVELLAVRDLTGESGGSGDPAQPAQPAAELVTRHVGHLSLATFSPRDLRQAAALVAACTETVADLHSVGIVHRRIDPSHVLIDERGRPVLTGFAGAALVGEDDDGGPAARPAVDVAALGRLLGHIAQGPPESDPIPERRFTKRTRTATYQRRALLNLADQATAETVTARPGARSLGAAIRAVVPDAVLVPAPSAPSHARLHAPIVGVNGGTADPSAAAPTSSLPHPGR